MKVWPFLFSRGYVLDYQMIVCPGAFQEGRRWAAFSRIVAKLIDNTTQRPATDYLTDHELGRWGIMYMAGPAKHNGQDAADVAGRAVRMVYGIAFREENHDRAEAERLFAQVTPSLLADFKAFWDQRKGQQPHFSEAVGSEPPPSPWRLAALAGAGVALLFVAIAFGMYLRIDTLSDRIATLSKEKSQSAPLEEENKKLQSQSASLAAENKRLQSQLDSFVAEIKNLQSQINQPLPAPSCDCPTPKQE
jgi:cell division protein FtsB